jgi:hypothetical protein
VGTTENALKNKFNPSTNKTVFFIDFTFLLLIELTKNLPHFFFIFLSILYPKNK